MTLHLRPLPPIEKKRCDTRAYLEAKARVHRDLQNTKAEKEIDLRMPRHFAERQNYKQTGGVE